LSESHGVARSASSLVKDFSSEIVSLDVSEIVILRNLSVWDVLRVGILFLPLLSLLKSLDEIFIRHVSEFLSLGQILVHHEELRLLCAILSLAILFVRFLEHASISFEAEILSVNGID
jgi:hypothetical protein